MQKGIFEYFDKVTELQKELGFANMLIDTVFADKLFDCMMNQGILPTENMKKSFYFDNKILNNKEAKIWD